MSFVGGVPVPARLIEIQARLAPPAPPPRRDAGGFEAALADARIRVAGPATTVPTGPGATMHTPGGAPFAAATAMRSGATGDDVIPQALELLGVPYVWGGNDPATGVDCSGFTRFVFRQFGVDLPRVSTDQARTGSPVASLAEAQPGDLLAFGSPVDHVAIYLGDNRMVHAAGTGKGVRIDDVYRTPTAIRRHLPAASAPAIDPAGFGPFGTFSTRGAAASIGTVDTSPSESAYADLFAAAGARHGVDPILLSAVARAESAFDPAAVSSAGALGLMQFMPGTAAGLGIDPLDPAQAVDGAARYLAQQLERFGAVELALAAYNAGPGAVARYGGIPPYTETQNYVTKVLRYQAEARASTAIGAAT